MKFPKVIYFKVKNENDLSTKVVKHVSKNKYLYLSLAATTAFQFIDVAPALAATGDIDAKGKQIFHKIAKVVKWAIIVRGTIRTGQDALAGDTSGAKSNFLGHLLTYALLLALPWGMDQVDSLFASEPAEATIPETGSKEVDL